MQYQEALAHLDALTNYEITPRAGAIDGLSIAPIQQIMTALGDPHTAYPVIHVTGTNGKGSSIRMIEGLIQAMGLRAGSYTSPHLETVNERIRVGAETIGDEDFARAVGDVALAVESGLDGSATWFETVTAAAFLHFANEAIDVAIIEVGLLGRFDATNVVRADVAVVTNVGLDHTSGEGDWRARVAGEKAGIIEPTSVLVLGELDAATRPIFDTEGARRTVERGTDFEVTEDLLAVGGRLIGLRTPRGLYDDVFLNLHGSHQSDNAALALAATEEFFDRALPNDVVEEAFGSVEMPGRLEIVHRSPTVVIDTAHNVAGATALAQSIEADFNQGGRKFLLLGMQDGRVASDVCEALRVRDYHLVVACTAPTQRGVDAQAVAEAVGAAGGNVDVASNVEAAIDHLMAQAEDDDLIVVAGSNTVVGIVRNISTEF